MRTESRPRTLLLFALGVLAAAILFRLDILRFLGLGRKSFSTSSSAASAAAASVTTTAAASKFSEMAASTPQDEAKGQVYFLSHGGPPTMFDTNSAPYKAWIKYGKAVADSKPKGLIVVSAHWENPANSDGVVVNEDQTNPLVYDFYGFPSEYYQQTFVSRGNNQMLSDVKDALKASNVRFSTAKRGLDHGVWVPFKVAFAGRTDIPIIQVSLPGDSNPISAAKLGRALAPLRELGYGVMGTGQAVHNLRDFMMGRQTSYGDVFLKAASAAVADPDPANATINLFRHPQYRNAHPSPEHLLPLVVAAAAVEKDDKLRTLFVDPNGALGWGMWMWNQKPQLEASAEAAPATAATA